MKEKYIDLMELALSAYTDEHIKRYFDDVKNNGLTEHGFPRLTANIGILIAHGRRRDLLSMFLEMMEFCCKTIPLVKAANDFSVREILSCISEIERMKIVDMKVVGMWKAQLAAINPIDCYTVIATTPEDNVKNWALFTGVSEFFRQKMGLCSSEAFIDVQLSSQFKWIDENGMYMDNETDIHHPIVYDIVARGLFSILLDSGYRGQYYDKIDDFLKRAGLLTLKMQSPNGEIAFGGRSNQFIHNEAWMVAIYEYEAKRYARAGNMELAREFKAAIRRAVEVTEYWLSMKPIYHIKNRFRTETNHGCERYAYFDKYMITVASDLYVAYLICDDSVSAEKIFDVKPEIFAASRHFHKFFLKAGGYGLEFDLNGDSHYDACGLGRVHRQEAPSAICLSTPCASEPSYAVSIEEPKALSICPGVLNNGEWVFATDPETKYEIVNSSKDDNSASATLRLQFLNGSEVVSNYKVNENGVQIKTGRTGQIAYMLPAFYFDGENYSEITVGESSLSVSYNGWICCYTTNGKIIDAKRLAANRNGYYRTYIAEAKDNLEIKIEIRKK